MKVAVVGAGGVGGYVGGHMARAGVDVTLIDQWPEHVECMKKHGLSLEGVTPEESRVVPVRALHVCDAQFLAKEEPIDVAIIATKCYDTRWATELIAPYLAPNGCVVSLQNSTMEEEIAGIVGWGRVLGCIASIIAVELYKPGHIKRTIALGSKDHTVFRIGECHGRVTARAKAIAALLQHADYSEVTTNLWGERWSKLVINAMRNGLSAITALNGNERDLNESPRWVSIRLASEAIRVGQALGYALVPMQGMDPELLARAGEGDKEGLEHAVSKLVGVAQRRRADQRPSMAQDIERGRRTESDYINGLIARKGAEIGIPTPLNAKLHELVKAVERGTAKPGPGLIDGI